MSIKVEKNYSQDYSEKYTKIHFTSEDNEDQILRKIKVNCELLQNHVKVYDVPKSIIFSLVDKLKKENFSCDVILVSEEKNLKKKKLWLDSSTWTWYEYMRNHGLINNKCEDLYGSKIT